jgi:DNA-binding IclR family transcriptional regulator
MCEMPQGKQTVSDEEILAALDDIRGGFASASEIADYFEHTRQWAHERLSNLQEEGRVRRKRSGEQSVIWWTES